MLQKNAIK